MLDEDGYEGVNVVDVDGGCGIWVSGYFHVEIEMKVEVKVFVEMGVGWLDDEMV